MSAQYLTTRDDTSTVIKVMGLGSADAVLASARSAGGVLTHATVTSATVDDAVVFTAALPVLAAGRYELDVVSLASDGACSQLVRAILQVREGIASLATAATTYEVTASTDVASIAVTLVGGNIASEVTIAHAVPDWAAMVCISELTYVDGADGWVDYTLSADGWVALRSTGPSIPKINGVSLSYLAMLPSDTQINELIPVRAGDVIGLNMTVFDSSWTRFIPVRS